MIKCLISNKPYYLFDNKYTDDELRDLSKNNQLICPRCGKPYLYCHGKVVTAYFKHFNNDSCHDPEPETDEHIMGKTMLYKFFSKYPEVKDLDLETYFPEEELRPDITFTYKGQRYAIEYQCSPIATEYINRHEKYERVGIKDIWICGTSKYLGKNKLFNYLEDKVRFYFDPSRMAFLRYENGIEDFEDCATQTYYPNFTHINGKMLTLAKNIWRTKTYITYYNKYITFYDWTDEKYHRSYYGNYYVSNNGNIAVATSPGNISLETVLNGGVECQE